MLSSDLMRLSKMVIAAAVTAVAACSSSSSPGIGSDASVGDASVGDAAAGDAGGGGDDGSASGGTCHGTANVVHRAQATACSSHAGMDAGCNVQPHDECLTDSDCGAGHICLCESPPSAGQPCPGGVGLPSGNVCVPSTCQVDSDCGECGVCQAQYACGQAGSYHCQTKADTCFPSSTDYAGNGCTFETDHWVLTQINPCPG